MTATSSQQHLQIEQLGHSGDGLLRYEGQVFYIPETLPGEKVHVRFNGSHCDLLARESDSPERVTPVCALAEPCGGCTLQHMALPALLDWKMSRVRNALQAAGYVSLPTPTSFQTPSHSRQRLDAALQRVDGGMVLGLHQRGGDPVNMTECALIHPRLMALLEPLRDVLSGLGALTGRGGIAINLLESGPDITLETPSPLSSSDRRKLADFARTHAIPRITWRAAPGKEMETVVQWSPVFHSFAGVKVAPPPATFLQATREAEQSIVDAVLNALPSLNRKDRLVELYAGCGTLTFPLAQKGHVKAYEGSAEAMMALRKATHGTRAEGEVRDLNRQPLLPHDLKSARAVILDPPYNGAGKQLSPLARSDVKDIVYISCNPAALTKDLAPLHKAGFQIIDWHVVDQFLWSSDVETVITLSRDAKRLKKIEKKRKG
ncbi:MULTISPECIES: class I SAM-dependent RNA methyltransferase [unclassified Saccharibacter]|uniref:class I SAM-dependent RNA methyltransferase n=1 Tax=unclassified Saccharibacter TaxID=2648722 RepID=UPI001326953C|nr:MULTISPECIES: class I SAM-dependent RNA methyltransferase [unclassified Saccharibacter]MXV35437.1 class I SAM-dependent RNA methyltransferase [Saccharibacter sp. EH611]MXV58097.1 class I SAM-dependent RNA methyltransferase [Saccharibacter sp. EH70]MXV65371.1 class I SAM-dependent RNA methyltransferase [Saccharibacter sp. EH60]